MNGLFDTIRDLRKICWDIDQKPESYRKDPINFLQIHLIRRSSVWITYCIKDTSITPNQVSVAMIGALVLGCVLLAFGGYALSLSGIAFIFLSIVLDAVDGELARYKKIFSYTGFCLDRVYHHLMLPLIFGAVTVGIVRHSPDTAVLVAGVVATAVSIPVSRMKQVNILLVLLTVVKPAYKLPDPALRKNDREGALLSTAKPDKDMFKYLLTSIYSDTVITYVMMILVSLHWERGFVLFYGATLPVVGVFKFIVRTRELYGILSDPKRVDDFIDGDWSDFD